MADAAGFHLDAHLSSSGLRSRALDDFEITSRLAYLDGFHANPFLFLYDVRERSGELCGNFLAGGIGHFV